jgi:hypothetical protein
MDEHDAVAADEFLLRRIHQRHGKLGLEPSVAFEAFYPSSGDSTGLSVVRAHFSNPAEILSFLDPAKAGQHYVSQLCVRDVRELGLTIIPEPETGGPRGHAVIPELSRASYQQNKQKWKPVLYELAKLASKSLVHRPT